MANGKCIKLDFILLSFSLSVFCLWLSVSLNTVCYNWKGIYLNFSMFHTRWQVLSSIASTQQWQCSIKGNVSHFVEMSSSDIHQLLLYFSGGWVNYGKRFILGDPLTNEAESRLYYIHVKGTSLCNNHHRWCLIFCRGTVRHVFSTVQWSWHFATVIYCMSLQRKSSANNTCAL